MATVNPVQTTTYDLVISNNPIKFGTGTNINAPDVGVFGDTSANWNVTNLGFIQGGASGVEFESNSKITNAGTIIGSALSGGDGIDLLAGGAVKNLAGGTISGTAAAVSASAGSVAITNAGTMSSAHGLGLNFFNDTGGAQTVTDSGVVDGGYGIAILFGQGVDTLNVATSATITGRVIAPSGTGTLNLSGAGSGTLYGRSEGVNATTGIASQFVGWDGFSTVNVKSGVWTLAGGGYYDKVVVAKGATFIVNDTHPTTPNGTPNDGGIGPLHNAVIKLVNNGTWISETTDTRLYYDPAAPLGIAYSGTGSLKYEGPGVRYITPNESFTIPGGVTVEQGSVIILGKASANATVNSGATLQIGGGGATFVDPAVTSGTYTDNGLTGSVTGSITDNGAVIFARLNNYSSTVAISGSGSLTKDGAATLTLTGPYGLSGQTIVNAGTLDIKGPVTGGGTATINAGALQLGSSFTENVDFAGTSGLLDLADSQGYTGTITGFSTSGGTQLDLRDIGFVSAAEATFAGTSTGGVLTVTDGTHKASIALFGNYLASTFVASSDGHGGTLVHDPASAAASVALAAPAPHG